LFDNRVLYQNL